MEGLAACFEDLADSRTGNAGRHDLIRCMDISQRTPGRRLYRLGGNPAEGCGKLIETSNSGNAPETVSHSAVRQFAPASISAWQVFASLPWRHRHDGRCCVVPSTGRGSRRSHGLRLGLRSAPRLAQIASDAKPTDHRRSAIVGDLVAKGNHGPSTRSIVSARAPANHRSGAIRLRARLGTLHTDVAVFLDDPLPATRTSTVDADHGRIETRGISVSQHRLLRGIDAERTINTH